MLQKEPRLFLGEHCITNVECIDILGVSFSAVGNYASHVTTRLTKCRNSSFALSGAGMCYPGLASETKSHLFKTICQPTLMYGLDPVPISNAMVKQLENTQGAIMKRVCGIPKRSHHLLLFDALDIVRVFRPAHHYVNYVHIICLCLF